MNFNKYIAQIDNNLQFVWDEAKTDKGEVIKLEDCWSDDVGPFSATIRLITWRHPNVIDELLQHGTVNSCVAIQD